MLWELTSGKNVAAHVALTGIDCGRPRSELAPSYGELGLICFMCSLIACPALDPAAVVGFAFAPRVLKPPMCMPGSKQTKPTARVYYRGWSRQSSWTAYHLTGTPHVHEHTSTIL